MLRLLLAAAALVGGVALGLLATRASLSGHPPLGAVHDGAWTSWPDAGTPNADPYARALFARDGRLPLPAAVGLRFLAEADDAGQPLVGRCDYVVGGRTPIAQAWTLTMLDPDGTAHPIADLRPGFTSQEAVRTGDGEAVLAIAEQARPGNWLPARGDGRFALMLSLYDTSLGVAVDTGGPVPALPTITKGACR